MKSLLCIFIFAIIIISLYNYKSHCMHKKFVETFQEDMYYDISEPDKQIYFSIIDTYQLLLERDPHEDELNFEFSEIKLEKSTIPKLFNKLKNSTEYKRLNDIQDHKPYALANSNNDIQDYTEVTNLLNKMMPLNVDDDKDLAHIDFLVMKYRSLSKDKDKFEKYVKSTPEYKDYQKIVKKSEIITTQPPSDKKETEDSTTNLVDKISNIEFKISRPKIGESTIKESRVKSEEYNELLEQNKKNIPTSSDTCEFYNEFQKNNAPDELSKVQHKRNLDQLKYHCEMSKQYENVDSNMVLLSDQKWSVPQKHTPLCYSQSCDVNDPYSQTSLIGTLLHDISNDKILPSFEYKEYV